MTQVLLIIHLIITVVMIGLILLQRSEGGGLGIGGGGGGLGGFAGPRATANILTKATMTCFALFVALSLILAVMAGHKGGGNLIDQLETVPVAAPTSSAPVEPMPNPVKPNVPVGE